MPRHNKRKSRWNWERSGQGAISGATYGYSVGGPPGAVVGAITGGVTGGLSGRDTTINRAPYDEAIREFSYRRRGQARVAADEHAAQTGAGFASRGLNTSELAAGAIAANRGRFMRAAEQDISQFSANMEFRIAEAERQAMLADDEETRQGWLDLATQLGMQALAGDFTPKKDVDRDMVASLRRTDPKAVERWLSGRISDEEFVGIYNRYNQIYGEPGSLDRRFSDLEHGKSRGPLPEAPSIDLKGKYSGMQAAILNMQQPGQSETIDPEVKERIGRLQGVIDSEGMEALNLAFDLNELLGERHDIEGLRQRQQGEYQERLNTQLRSADSPEQLPTIEEERLDRLPTIEEDIVSPSVGASWWDEDYLSQQSGDNLLVMWDDMQKILRDPNATEIQKQRAAGQLDLIKQEYTQRIGMAEAETAGSVGVTQAWQREKEGLPKISPTVEKRSRWITTRQVEPPPAEQKGRPEPQETANMYPIESEWVDDTKMKGLPDFFAYVYDDEKGYNRRDPSFAGITQRIYDSWNNKPDHAPDDVKNLAKHPEIVNMFYQDYLIAARVPKEFQQTPALAYMYVDAAVHTGFSGARRILREAMRALESRGVVNPSPAQILQAFNTAKRKHYGKNKGWLNRAERVLERSLSMLEG